MSSIRCAFGLGIATICLSILWGAGGCTATNPQTGGSSFFDESYWPKRLGRGLDTLAGELAGGEAVGLDGDNPSASTGIAEAKACGTGMVLRLSPKDGESDEITRLYFVSWGPKQKKPLSLAGGMEWTLYEPVEGPAIGLAVFLGDSKHVRQAMLKRGWAVLKTPGPARYYDRRANPLRVEIETVDDLDAAAMEIARAFDDDLAEWAYGTEGVLEFLDEERPNLPRDRTALLGFSIGAIAAPTVASRLPDRFGAAVLTAGGADLLTIARTTAKPDSGLAVEWGEDTPDNREELLREAYLAHAKLDPYHAAAALANTAVLIYHAALDQVAPAATGETLFERLGGARRYVFPVGHGQMLRIVMRLQAGAIADQLEEILDQREWETR